MAEGAGWDDCAAERCLGGGETGTDTYAGLTVKQGLPGAHCLEAGKRFRTHHVRVAHRLHRFNNTVWYVTCA